MPQEAVAIIRAALAQVQKAIVLLQVQLHQQGLVHRLREAVVLTHLLLAIRLRAALILHPAVHILRQAEVVQTIQEAVRAVVTVVAVHQAAALIAVEVHLVAADDN